MTDLADLEIDPAVMREVAVQVAAGAVEQLFQPVLDDIDVRDRWRRQRAFGPA